NNAAIIGIYQDSMLGCYRFTRENIDFTQKDAMNLLMMFNRINPEALKRKRNERVSSFEILSQILPPMTSIYRWESRLEEAAEQLLLIKTLHRLYPEVERTILEAHPYQTPEVVALPIEAVASGYLDWLTAAVIPPDKLATIAD
ncbi:MAG: hypothetical protein EBZ36_14700, partial [Acidobacteria bacterium]|nr:hypothetical protein [Acidobacteriota bacterium]